MSVIGKLLCKIGLHDWEVMDYKAFGFSDDSLHFIEDKVCLCCHKISNKLEEYNKAEKDRERLAKELYDKSKERK